MPEMNYCDMRGVDVHESFCLGCSIPKENGCSVDECPFAGTAIEEMV